jgi:hypothetical protein
MLLFVVLQASSASSSMSSVAANECNTAKRWNPSKITKRIVVGNVSKYATDVDGYIEYCLI